MSTNSTILDNVASKAATYDNTTEDAVWARSVVSAAQQYNAKHPLPTKRSEYWRYTAPTAFCAADTVALPPKQANSSQNRFENFAEQLDCYFLVLNDGKADWAQSNMPSQGCLHQSIAEAMQDDESPFKPYFGELANRAMSLYDRPLAAYGLANARQGLAIKISAQLTKPLRIVYNSQSDDCDVLLHHVVATVLLIRFHSP